MQTQPTANRQISITEQVGSLLPQLHQMACFTNFVSYKVDNLEESQREKFSQISDDLSVIFFRLNELYVTMSNVERKSIQISNSSHHE